MFKRLYFAIQNKILELCKMTFNSCAQFSLATIFSATYF